MDINEMLDGAKQALGLDTDYKLAKRLGISTGRITELRNGGKPTIYIITRLAIIQGHDPMKEIAKFQAENAKSKEQRGFWASFFSIVALWIILGVVPPSYSTFLGTAQAAGSTAVTDVTAHYAKCLKDFLHGILAVFCRYFTCNWHVKFS